MLKFNLKFNCMRIIIFPAAASIWFAWKLNNRKGCDFEFFYDDWDMNDFFRKFSARKSINWIQNEVNYLKWILKIHRNFLGTRKTPKVQGTQVTTKPKHPRSPYRLMLTPTIESSAARVITIKSSDHNVTDEARRRPGGWVPNALNSNLKITKVLKKILPSSTSRSSPH